MHPSVVTKTRWLPILAATLGLAACDEDGPGGLGTITPQGASTAYDKWAPGPNDTCTREIHDGYAVVGFDGKLYPTWHPPRSTRRRAAASGTSTGVIPADRRSTTRWAASRSVT